MGMDVDVEIEGEEESGDLGVSDPRLFTDICVDILAEDETSLLFKLARKNDIDLSPFKKFPEDLPDEGPWMKPGKLRKSVLALYKALKAEGDGLIGKELSGHTMKNTRDLKYYRMILLSVAKTCRMAKEKGKRVRFTIS